MSREIKFRGIDTKTNEFVYGYYGWSCGTDYIITVVCIPPSFSDPGGTDYEKSFDIVPESLGQYTGFTDSKGVECYEGDIKREEIEEDEGDRVFYYVCVWVKEWAMFAWICITDGEYQKYIDEGAESLDETMFWTYAFNAEDIANATICGNIYQSPELLNQ